MPEKVVPAPRFDRLPLALVVNRDSETRHIYATLRVTKADAVLDRSRDSIRRLIASRTFQRISTTDPTEAPLTLVCPNCDRPLQYLRSHLGGVSARQAEQWD